MRRIEWTEPAQGHLRKIRDFIARDSAENARRFVETVRSSIAGVRLFPDAAARVPEWNSEDVREIYVGQYRVIFDYDVNVINVLAVFHSARMLPGIDEF